MCEGICDALDVPPILSYSTEPAALVSLEGPPELKDATALVCACANLERQLHAAFLRLAEVGIADARLAVVIGQSLLFPARVVVLSLVGALSTLQSRADSHDMYERRKRAAALLERRVVRALTELSEDAPIRPMSVRILLAAPRGFGVAGWSVRHWNGASTRVPEPERDDDAVTGDDADMPEPQDPQATPAAPAAPAAQTPQMTRMRLPQSIQARRTQRRGYVRHPARAKAAPAEVIIQCGAPGGTSPDLAWHECTTVLRGVGI